MNAILINDKKLVNPIYRRTETMILKCYTYNCEAVRTYFEDKIMFSIPDL